jgi:pyruvate/2-oxoglutarate dehydrogenase complex dihydrolipoamide acyltransferase (E2) component
MSNPIWFKRFGGTVGMSSIGDVWSQRKLGHTDRPSDLMITVGGITTNPDTSTAICSLGRCSMTISVDHDLVDGAPTARFARRLADLVETADGL